MVPLLGEITLFILLFHLTSHEILPMKEVTLMSLTPFHLFPAYVSPPTKIVLPLSQGKTTKDKTKSISNQWTTSHLLFTVHKFFFRRFLLNSLD